MKERSKHMMCCGCGFVVLAENMFIKEYKHTAICLCKKCAKELSKEIQQKYKVEITRCKDCVLKYKSNDGEIYCYYSGMPIKPNGYCHYGTKGVTDHSTEKGGE